MSIGCGDTEDCIDPTHDLRAVAFDAVQTAIGALLQPHHDTVGHTAAIDHGEPHEAGPLRLEE